MDAGRRAMLFREVNDRIFELLDRAEPDLPGEFLCECGRECGRRVELLPAEFAQFRRGGRAIRAGECRRRSLFQRPRPEAAPAPGFAVLN